MKLIEAQCKSMLVASKLPSIDYVVNPYTGCLFACDYCYASFMGRFVGEPIEAWGSYLTVKTNAVEVFRNDLRRLSPEKRNGTILLSSVTDAWQGPEKKYRLTRRILESLREADYPGRVHILTKSPLILRDIDVIAALRSTMVGVSVTTANDEVGRFMEARAPIASRRLHALAALAGAGLSTYAFVGPLLPHYRYRLDELDALFREIRETGTTRLFVEHLNTSPYILKRLSPLLSRAEPEVRAVYQSARTEMHRAVLSENVMHLVAKYGFEIFQGRVLDHNRDKRVVVR